VGVTLIATVLVKNVSSLRVRLGRYPKGYLLLTGLLAIISTFLVSGTVWAAVSSDPDPIVDTDNGQVRAVLPLGDKIYLGGTFTSIDDQPRSRLAAIDADTGKLDPNWTPKANNMVRTLTASPDGSRIYAGGDFTTSGGADHNHVVAIDAATGTVDQTWNVQTNNTVFSIVTIGSRVYLGGQFGQVNNKPRKRLAAVDAATGVLDPNWVPTVPGTDNNVRALTTSPTGTRVYVGGNYTSVSGQPRNNLAAVDPTTGALRPWHPDPCYPVYALATSGARVFVAGGGAPPTCNAGGWGEAFDDETGDSLWRKSSDGDFQAVTVLGSNVYYGGHFGEIPWVPAPGHGDNWRKLASVDMATGALNEQWKPKADKGAWAIAADPSRNRIYAGGEFTKINNLPRRGFAQFSQQP
jgi:hypothetical protein